MKTGRFARTSHALRTHQERVYGLLLLLAVAALTPGCETEPKSRFSTAFNDFVPPELWEASNHGRIPFNEQGYFDFPDSVRSVVVDVGAYKLKVSRRFLSEGAAIVGVEPMSEPWAVWPDDRRIIGIPTAISLERAVLDFNINKTDVTSSLLETIPGALLSTDTVEVRKVPSVRLEDVLERIPSDLPIIFMKTDTQGMDLAVLMSGGEELRRIKEIRSEIVVDKTSYAKGGDGSMGTEKEFHEYMLSKGFSLKMEGVAGDRWYVEAIYENDHWTR